MTIFIVVDVIILLGNVVWFLVVRRFRSERNCAIDIAAKLELELEASVNDLLLCQELLQIQRGCVEAYDPESEDAENG